MTKYTSQTIDDDSIKIQKFYDIHDLLEDLDYFKTYDYVIKADVVKIIVNKIDDLKGFQKLKDLNHLIEVNFEGNPIIK